MPYLFKIIYFVYWCLHDDFHTAAGIGSMQFATPICSNKQHPSCSVMHEAPVSSIFPTIFSDSQQQMYSVQVGIGSQWPQWHL